MKSICQPEVLSVREQHDRREAQPPFADLLGHGPPIVADHAGTDFHTSLAGGVGQNRDEWNLLNCLSSSGLCTHGHGGTAGVGFESCRSLLVYMSTLHVCKLSCPALLGDLEESEPGLRARARWGPNLAACQNSQFNNGLRREVGRQS